jgi:dienelactone hydrolase
MIRKEDVRFPAEGGIELSAWLFIPERRATPLPAITMAHGYAGTKYHGLEPMAEAFAEAGCVVLVHDHRGFGDSGGEPRQDVNPWQQITDWRRAISYLQDRQRALLAARDMPAQRRCAAALDRRHHLELAEAHMAGIGFAPRRSMAAENIRDLQPWTRHVRRVLSGRLGLQIRRQI